MGLEIARGLAHLHSHNYVHRWLSRATGKRVVEALLREGSRLWGWEVGPQGRGATLGRKHEPRAESGGEEARRGGVTGERGRGRGHRGEGGVRRGGGLGRRRNQGRGRGVRARRERGGAWAVGGAGSYPPPPRCPLLTSRPCPAPSDLALRNCLLTSDLTVRIGDYGLAHSNYKVGAALHQGGGRGEGPHPPDPAPARPPGGLLPDPRAPVDPAALGGARAPRGAARDLHGGGPEPREQHLVRGPPTAGCAGPGRRGRWKKGHGSRLRKQRLEERPPGGAGQGSDLSPPSAPRRSLGVTLWELFEFGAQPYRHLSDEEVLAFVVRQQHVKLARPRLKLPYADYW